MVIKDIIVLENEILKKGTYGVSGITTDAFSIMPFQYYNNVYLPDQNIKNGDMLELTDGKIWKFKSLYKVHTYELATVLGNENGNLLVYGNKIGEHVIKNYRTAFLRKKPEVFEVQRGDELLLHEYACTKYSILHNITQAAIKYNASLRTQ